MRTFGTLSRLGAKLRSGAHRLGGDRAGSFKRDEKGAVAIMTALTIGTAVVIVGGSIDVYRFEMLRKRCQNALDRGVLAAASLDQSVRPKTVVETYMKSARCDLPADADFDITDTDGFRSVKVSATFDLPMTFLRLANQTEWSVPVTSTAQESERRVEVAVVLDLSTSMAENVSGRRERRIDALKPAASDFVRRMLNTEKERELTSISIVPYSSNVSLGREMFDHLAGRTYQRTNPYSSCFHLENSDFGEGLPDFRRRRQVSHFTPYGHDYYDLFFRYRQERNNNHWDINTGSRYTEQVGGEWIANTYGWRCPADAFAWLKRDPSVYSLTDGREPFRETVADPEVAELQDGDEWSLARGRQVVLWSQNIWHQVGHCDRVENRSSLTCDEDDDADVPRARDRTPQRALDDGALEYVDDYGSVTYLSNDPEYLAHRIDNLPLQGSTATHLGARYAYMLLDPAFRASWSSFMRNGLAVGPDRPDSFRNRPASWEDTTTYKYMVIMTDGRLNNSFRSTSNDLVQYRMNPRDRDNPGTRERAVNYSGGNKRKFEETCELAKEKGIILFTIGFDLGGASNASTRRSLEKCATSRSSHYFNVEDGDIGGAFDAIAATIEKLRLTS